MKSRFSALMVLSLAIGACVAGRAAYLQIYRDPRLTSLAKRQFGSKMLVTARRGLIVDRNGEPLAVNSDIHSLAANPNKIQNKKWLSRLLAKALKIPQPKLYEKLKEKREFTWIKRRVPDELVDQFKRWGIQDASGELLPGLWLVKESDRQYPHAGLASSVIGTVNVDNEGMEGVELWKNSRLEGKVANIRAVRDALGRPTLYDASKKQDARDGETIELTLDASLQFAVEEALRNSIERTRAKNGLVVVMDAVRGDILAIANQAPSGSSDLRKNRAVTDGYEPGSILKPLLLASALGKGMKLSDRINGEHGSFTVQGRRISEAETHEKFDSISLEHAMAVSSNVIYAKLALKVGQDRFATTLRSFGFGQRTGVGFPGEISGWLPPLKKPWQPLTLANVGFGQGLMVTPIQMVRAYAAFANGGWLVQPKLLKNPAEGEAQPAPVRVLPAAVADAVTQSLKAVVASDGTGKKAALDGYVVAGKTGTAQTVDPVTKRYSGHRYIGSFVGYAVGVDPKIVIFTYLDEAKGSYYASDTAAPLFHDVLNAVVTRYGIPVDASAPRILAKKDLKRAQETTAEKIAEKSSDQILSAQAHAEPPKLELQGSSPEGRLVWKMPNLRGLTTREALDLMKGYEFRLDVKGNGLIQSQSPESGARLVEGDLVRLKLSDQF